MTRFRSTDLQVSTPLGYVLTNGNGVQNPPVNVTSCLSGYVSSIEDVSFSNFAARRNRGEICIGYLDMVKRDRQFSPMSFHYGGYPYWGGSTMDWFGDLAAVVEQVAANYVGSLSGDIDQMQTIALTRAYAGAKRANLISGENAAEIGQTVGMLRRPFGNARDLLSRMAKARNRTIGKTAKSMLKATKDVWLEYRYGWRPILLDGNEIVKRTLSKREKVNVPRLVARASEKQSRQSAGSFQDVTLPYPFQGWKVSGGCSLTEEVSANAGVIYCVKNSTASHETAKFYGLRTRDIPATVWELIPYSFVVDWFVNVGTWLDAVTPDPDIEILGSWCTTVTKTHSTLSSGTVKERVEFAAGQFTDVTGTYGSSLITTDRVQRWPNPGVPTLPTTLAKPPTKLQTVDAIALLVKPILTSLKSFGH